MYSTRKSICILILCLLLTACASDTYLQPTLTSVVSPLSTPYAEQSIIATPKSPTPTSIPTTPTTVPTPPATPTFVPTPVVFAPMKVAQNFGAHRAHNVEMISHVDTSWAFDVVVVGNFAYVADDYVGLQVVDISAINELSNRISYGIGRLPNISTSKAPGLAVINGSVSGKPYAGKGTKGYRVVVRDNLAYVAGWGGMQIVDISDPASPKEMSFHRTPHYAFDIAIAKNYAYIANGFDGLRIVDISDPTAPVEINAYIPEEGYISVTVAQPGARCSLRCEI